MSIPVESKTKTGFKTVIASLIYLDNLTLNPNEFLKRMVPLGFNQMKLVFISDRVEKFEERFPSLAKFLQLRYKLQQVYLFWNILLLFVVCLVGIGINLLVFIKLS